MVTKLALLAFLSVCGAAHALAGDFSRNAQAIAVPKLGEARSFASPDGRNAVAVTFGSSKRESYKLLLSVRAGHTRITREAGQGIGGEILWSPDSKAFFLTSSDEGANGRFRTRLYLVGAYGVRLVDVNRVIEAAFGQPVACGWPERPNVVAVAWLGSSTRLLVAAQILNHSNCDSFGTFKLYEIALPGVTIVKSYDQISAKRRYGVELGQELLAARDDCVRRPNSCWVPSNHVGKKSR